MTHGVTGQKQQPLVGVQFFEHWIGPGVVAQVVPIFGKSFMKP